MSKDDSAALKGIAILMMLFLHLFAAPGTVVLYIPLLWIGDTPFAMIFARACSPVAFFLICSGYGLAYVYHRGRLNVRSQAKRLLRLYLNYWLILLVFVTIESFVSPDRYPGSMATVIENFTGWNVDAYDHPAWFLLPYVLLSLSSPWVFKLMDRLGLIKSLFLSFVLLYISMCITHFYIAPGAHHHEWYSIIVTYFLLLFYFVLGACINYKFEIGSIYIDKLRNHQVLTITLLISWFAIHLLTGSFAFNPFFVAAFMLIFINLKIRGLLRKVLVELGNKSMSMWLTHAFYYCYLCPAFIYGFKYPLLIFAVLVVISYLTAVVIQKVSALTINRIPILKR